MAREGRALQAQKTLKDPLVKLLVKTPKEFLLLVSLACSCFLTCACFVTQASLPCGLSATWFMVGNPHSMNYDREHKLREEDAGLDMLQHGMEPWAVTLILALLKTWWDFFHGSREEGKTLQGNCLNVI